MQKGKLYLFPGGQSERLQEDRALPFSTPVLCRCEKCGNTKEFLTRGHTPADMLVVADEPFHYLVYQYTMDDEWLNQRLYACADCGSTDIGIYPVKIAADVGDDVLLELAYAEGQLSHKLLNSHIDPLPPHDRDVAFVGDDSFIAVDKRTVGYLTMLRMRRENNDKGGSQ